MTLWLAMVIPLILGQGTPEASPRSSVTPIVVQHLDIPYSNLSTRLRLDVFHPDQKQGLPVVFFVHGGGWFTGDKDFFGVHRTVARSIARMGYVVVAPNYRLSPEVRHPVHVQDVGRALAWTLKHVQEHGGDPNRITLVGHSAGAHLVSLVATDPDLWGQAPDLPLAADYPKLAGVVGLAGVYLIPAGKEYMGLAGKAGLAEQLASVKGPDGKFFNPFKIAFGEDETICRKASPITHARKGLPPFLLMVAERDLPGLDYMAKEFDTALTTSGNLCKFINVPQTNHISLLAEVNKKGSQVSKELAQFLVQVSDPKAQKEAVKRRIPMKGEVTENPAGDGKKP